MNRAEIAHEIIRRDAMREYWLEKASVDSMEAISRDTGCSKSNIHRIVHGHNYYNENFAHKVRERYRRSMDYRKNAEEYSRKKSASDFNLHLDVVVDIIRKARRTGKLPKIETQEYITTDSVWDFLTMPLPCSIHGERGYY